MPKSTRTSRSPGAYSERPVSEERIPVPDLALMSSPSAKRTVDHVESRGGRERTSAPLGVYGSPAAKPSTPVPAPAASADGIERRQNESGVVAKSGKSDKSTTLRGFRAAK